MEGLRRRLPPPNALVMFEAVARRLSFTAAARELGVSQAATSRQIRNLEDHLGVDLFKREGRRIALSSAGDQLFAAVTMGFGHILTTLEGLQRQTRPGQPLTIGATVAFSTLWLMPRLGRFHAAAPSCEIRLLSSDREDDWQADGVDVLLAYGVKSVPGFRGQRLFGDRIIAVAHPNYFDGREPPATAADLTKETLVHTESDFDSWMSWPTWFGKLGVKVDRKLPGLRFSTYTVAIQAALNGRGVALGWCRLVDSYLADKSLVPVTEAEITPHEGYTLWVANRVQSNPWVKDFTSWIISEASGDGTLD